MKHIVRSLSLVFISVTALQAAPKPKPNVILIVTDDLG